MVKKTDDYGEWEETQEPSGAIFRVLLVPSQKFKDEQAKIRKEITRLNTEKGLGLAGGD